MNYNKCINISYLINITIIRIVKLSQINPFIDKAILLSTAVFNFMPLTIAPSSV